MNKVFNNVQLFKSSEDCDKFSKSVSYETLVIGATTTGTGYKQIRRLFLSSADKPLSAVGTLTSLLCNSAKVVEKWLQTSHVFRLIKIFGLVTVLSVGIISESSADDAINCKTGQQSCGTNCCWSVEGATLKITGGADGTIGYMGDYPKADKYPWGEYRGIITSADISGITNISKIALNGYGLTDITLSNDIKTISAESLESNSFTKIVLPDSVQTIGGENFRDCKQLISVEMPDSVTTISSLAFSRDPLLTSVKLSDSLITVNQKIFDESPNLKEIIISDTLLAEKVDNWNDDAFKGIAENVVIRCLGDSQKCTTALNKFLPDENGQCAVTYCLNGAKVQEASKEQCENAKKYYWSGTSCNNKKNGIKCAENWKQNEDFCNRIRYTPAEAAKVLTDDNNNSVTITFKK